MTLGTNLPVWPAIVFAYFEPVTTVIGFWAAVSDPTSFITRQLPSSYTTVTDVMPRTSIILAYSLGSIFLLLAALNILCLVISRDARVSRYYLVLLASADIGHMYANYKGMGPEVFWDFRNYNEMMIGNIWITLFLFVNRVGTLAGIFGRLRALG
ncbi:hypothetical protein ACN47E_001267 [Coniothyrium glycines]